MSQFPRNRYMPLFKAIMKHTIMVNSGMNDRIPLDENLSVTVQEWMVEELIVEQQEGYYSMVELSRMIGMPPSSFFRIVRQLQKAGLVEKYRIQSNKKSIVLRPTQLAQKIYEKRSTEVREAIWGDFFRELDGLGDAEIAALVRAFNKLNEHIPSVRYSQEMELVKVE